MTPGLFISFEGTEGGGKTTQVQKLAAALQSRNLRVRTLREPGGTPIGEEIRHLVKHHPQNTGMTPETELLLICAARAQLVREVIHPALTAGETVICDRFFDSTLAYQGYGRQLDLSLVREIIRFAVGSVVPDLTLLLHVPLAVSEARRRQRPVEQARDRMEEAGREFFARVEEGYLELARLEPSRVKVVDATRGVEEVAGEVLRLVLAALEPRFPGCVSA